MNIGFSLGGEVISSLFFSLKSRFLTFGEGRVVERRGISILTIEIPFPGLPEQGQQWPQSANHDCRIKKTMNKKNELSSVDRLFIEKIQIKTSDFFSDIFYPTDHLWYFILILLHDIVSFYKATSIW